MSRSSRHIPGHELAALQRGHLGQALATKLQTHLDSCERCTAAQKRIGVGLGAMAEIADLDAPELTWDHIGARVYWSTSSERRAKERGDEPYRNRIKLALVGVTAATLVAGAVVLWGGQGGEAPVASTVGAQADLEEVVLEEVVKDDALKEVVELGPEPTRPAAELLEGVVVFAQGAVLSDGQALHPNEPVGAGSTFTTTEGRLVVQFGANSAFRVGPHSRLAIERLDSERIALRIEGQVDVDITRRLPGQEFAVIAGDHEVQVRGTAFRVDYVGGELGVQCTRGKVVVSDGSHGVHVPAGQRFEILRNSLKDAALRALPMDTEALVQLDMAMQMPMLPVWEAPTAIFASTALLDLESGAGLPIAVDGQYVADGAFTIRTSIGQHEVALMSSDGAVGKGRLVSAAAGKQTRARVLQPSRPSAKGAATRKGQLSKAMEASPRTAPCLAQLAKHGLLAGSYLTLEVGVNADGSQSFLNLLDSNLSSAIQSCLRDAVDAERLPAGDEASFHFRLSY